MLEDRLDLEPEFLLRKWYQPRRFMDGPLLPGSAIQPDFGLLLHMLERAVDCFLAHPVRPMRIGQVAGDENLARPHLLQQLTDDLDVRRTDGILPDLARLIERQVEEPRGGARETDGLESTD